MPNVHIAITRRVKPGLEDQFERELRKFVRESLDQDSVSGVHLIRPPESSDSREFGILRSFDDEAAAEQFYESTLFQAWSTQVANLVEGAPTRRRLSGLEAFFRNAKAPLPPRWKMALITFLGVFPSVLLWSNLLPKLLPDLGYLVMAVLVNASVVASLTWVVMPLMTQTFRGWLHR